MEDFIQNRKKVFEFIIQMASEVTGGHNDLALLWAIDVSGEMLSQFLGIHFKSFQNAKGTQKILNESIEIMRKNLKLRGVTDKFH